MSEEELKPCPFCGGEAKIYDGDTPFNDIGCGKDDCPCQIASFFEYEKDGAKEEAIKAWNTRSAPSVDVEGVKTQFERTNESLLYGLKELGFEHKIEGGFHHVKGHNFKYKHVGLHNIATRIKQYLKEVTKPTPRNEEALRVFGEVRHWLQQLAALSDREPSKAVIDKLDFLEKALTTTTNGEE